MQGKVLSSKGEISLPYGTYHDIDLDESTEYFYLASFDCRTLKVIFNGDTDNFVNLNYSDLPFVLRDVPFTKISVGNFDDCTTNPIRISYHGLY